MCLTARTGMVDVCPERKFLVQELLPALVLMQTGQVQDMPLAIVPRESVQDEECPQPDWKYLLWDGYDNEKFEKIMDGSVLLNYEFLSETIPMELRIGQYEDGSGLALELVSWEEKEPEDWDTITVNLSVPCEKDHAFVDINNSGGQEICQWIEENGLGKATGRQQRLSLIHILYHVYLSRYGVYCRRYSFLEYACCDDIKPKRTQRDYWDDTDAVSYTHLDVYKRQGEV